MPWAALASCWPLPQQLLPASATGRGRRCCRSHPVGMSTVVAAAAFARGIFNLTRTGIAAELTAASEQRLPPVGGRCRIATKRGVQGSEAGAVASRMRVPFRARSSRWEPQPVTARPPIGGKQQSSGLLFSARVPPARNVYRGCCIMQPVRGIEETRPPAGGKKEPSGLFFSVWVPPARNVYRGCCRFDPYGNLSYIIQDRLFSKNKIYLR